MTSPYGDTVPQPPIQTCAACGVKWITHHTCPNAPRSTSAPTLERHFTQVVNSDPTEHLRIAIAEHRARHRLASTKSERLYADRVLWAQIAGGIHGHYTADGWSRKQAFPPPPSGARPRNWLDTAEAEAMGQADLDAIEAESVRSEPTEPNRTPTPDAAAVEDRLLDLIDAELSRLDERYDHRDLWWCWFRRRAWEDGVNVARQIAAEKLREIRRAYIADVLTAEVMGLGDEPRQSRSES